MPAAPAIRIDRLSKRYGRVFAVEDVSFEVAAGEVFGFLGPNGAGKTTTIRCLLGFVQPSQGTLSMLGEPVSTTVAASRARIGYVPGEVGFWPSLTGAEVLDHLDALHPRPATDRQALLDRFELSARDLDRPVRAYSRGMRQKVALVQAFQHRPDLVVLDEPTEGLDPLMQDRFLDLLRTFRSGGGTALMSSHILAEVEAIADRVAIIRAGSLVAVGDPISIAPDRRRRCTIRFESATAPSAIASIPGVDHVTVLNETTLRFTFTGSIPELLRDIAGRSVADLAIEPPKLADAFLGFYDDDEEAE